MNTKLIHILALMLLVNAAGLAEARAQPTETAQAAARLPPPTDERLAWQRVGAPARFDA